MDNITIKEKAFIRSFETLLTSFIKAKDDKEKEAVLNEAYSRWHFSNSTHKGKERPVGEVMEGLLTGGEFKVSDIDIQKEELNLTKYYFKQIDNAAFYKQLIYERKIKNKISSNEVDFFIDFINLNKGIKANEIYFSPEKKKEDMHVIIGKEFAVIEYFNEFSSEGLTIDFFESKENDPKKFVNSQANFNLPSSGTLKEFYKKLQTDHSAKEIEFDFFEIQRAKLQSDFLVIDFLDVLYYEDVTAVEVLRARCLKALNEIEALRPQPIVELQPQQATESAPQEKPFEFENKFDHVKENIVYDYFKSSLVDTNFITLDELHKFLKRAFQDRKNVDKLTFENSPTKQKVINIFHKYYSKKASKPYGKKEDYVSLLCNYFEGYKQSSVSSNFSK